MNNRNLYTVLTVVIPFCIWGASSLAHGADRPELFDLNTLLREMVSPPETPCFTDASETKRWETAGFTDASFETWTEDEFYELFPKELTRFTHQVRPTVVLFKHTGWTKSDVRRRIVRMAHVYAKCGIKIGGVKFVAAGAPYGWIDIDYSRELRDHHIATLTPTEDRPVFYFVRSSYEGESAYAWTRSKRVSQELTDTAWITRLSLLYSKQKDPSYSVEAHELGHILSDSGHRSGEKINLLANRYDLAGDDIELDQCESMRKHPLVRPL